MSKTGNKWFNDEKEELALVLVGVTSASVIHNASKRQDNKDQQNDRFGTYQERQRARARGEKKLVSQGIIPLHAQVDLDQALEIYDLRHAH